MWWGWALGWAWSRLPTALFRSTSSPRTSSSQSGSEASFQPEVRQTRNGDLETPPHRDLSGRDALVVGFGLGLAISAYSAM